VSDLVLGSADLIGLTARMSRRRAQSMRDALRLLWDATYGELGPFDEDLEATKKHFDPTAQGRRLRHELIQLPAVTLPTQLPELLAMPVGESRWLITPEGRVALEALTLALEESSESVTVSGRVTAALLEDLLVTYRRWNRHRLDDVVALLTGAGRPLRLLAIGTLLVLLVNRCTAPQRAMKRYSEGSQKDKLDDAFYAPAGAFADAIHPTKQRSIDKESLTRGWTLHEVTRRWPEAIKIESAHEGDAPITNAYVAPEHESALLTAAADALSKNRRVDSEALERAFDALVGALRAVAGTLASYGVLFERSSETARLRADLLRQFSAQREATADTA
jgi:hypothetical protein